ncbi:MAG: hypothetical protein WKG00_07730 [Polyangiaceae bacterium]
MSDYRSELPSLRQRIAELQEELRALRTDRVQFDAQVNLGPQARPFSRFMYNLGRGLSHLLRPRNAALRDAKELEVARAYVVWLERRVATLREEIAARREEAEQDQATRETATLRRLRRRG